MDKYIIESKTILKKYIKYFLCSAAAIQIAFSSLFLYLDNLFFSGINGMLAVVNLLIFVYIYNFTFDKIKPFINIYLVFLFFPVYLFIFIYWKESFISFIWFLLVPMGTSKIFTFKIILYWVLYISSLFILTLVVPDVLKLREKYIISSDHIRLINILVLFSVLYLFFLILYFNNKISVLRLNSISRLKKTNKKDDDQYIENREKYYELHRQIILTFERDEPFLSADFNISQLAVSLNTNATYISKTINICTGMNFNAFVNTYRIKKTKELLGDEELGKFTLVHIYTMAGFKHQSTFNKAFKQIEGVSPTQYLLQIQA